MRPALLSRRALVAAVITGAFALAPGSARAAFVADSTVSIQHTTPAAFVGGGAAPGTFSGTVEVQNTGANTATVRISLTNTTAAAANQFLTGFGFSLNGTLTTATLSGRPTTNWQRLGNSSNGFVNGSMFDTGSFGQFDLGAAIGSSWHTSGASVNGLASGQTGVFEFTIAGNGAVGLTAQSLMTYASTNGSLGIGVRFRTGGSSVYNDGSKVLAKIVTTPPPPPPPPPGGQVPAPPAVLLALAGVGCLLGRGAFRRKPAPTV